MGSVMRCGGQNRENMRKGNGRNDKRIKVGKEERAGSRETDRTGKRGREQMRMINGKRGRGR